VKAFGESPQNQIEQDLRRFKMMIETGEVPKTPHEHRKAAEDATRKQAASDDVQNASEASFPASDAPAWN
jgi:uncharacterized membrane protein